MSQAEALLAGVTVDDVVMFSSQYAEVEPHIVIGVDRFITVPDELKRLAVQYDHNMRTVTFDCPRYYDGRDMASMKIYINYINLNDKKVKGSHIAENVVVDNFDGSVMHFDWTIQKHVTPSKGNLAFLVCVRKVDTGGNESNHWNSELNTECYISEGMEFDSETIEYEYPDIVTQLLERMDSVEALATPEAMQGYANAWLEENQDKVLEELQTKGEEVLATIPADYTETSNLAAEASADARTKADAIIRTVTGNTIAVNDSSDDYLRGLRVFGKTKQYPGIAQFPSPSDPQELISVDNPNVYICNKNLLNIEDKKITTTGAYYYDVPTEFEPVIGETYTLSADAEFDTLPCLFSIGCGNRAYHNEMNQTQVEITEPGRVAITFTWRLTEAQIASGYTKLAFRLPRYRDKIAFNATVSNIQLELGTTATEYEPHERETIVLPQILHGIPVTSGGNYTDANGQQWICDEVDFERGVHVQRVYQRTFDGIDGETITLYSERNNVYGFALKITDVNMLKTSHAAMCTHFENIETGISSVDKECFLCGAGSTTIYVMVSKERIAAYSIDAFKAWLSENPITIIFQLAAPIEIPLTEDEIAHYKALTTNYHNTTVLNSANTEMEFRYNADTEIWINNLVKATAPIKSTTVTLSASKWVDTTYGYSQVVTMNGVTANSKVDLQPSPDQLADLTENNISLTTSNDNGVVTVHAIGSHPSSDMTMQVQITEVITV